MEKKEQIYGEEFDACQVEDLTFMVFEFYLSYYRAKQTLYFLMQDFYSNLLSFWFLWRRFFL